MTSGTGYIGSHTVAQLLEAGARVNALDNLLKIKSIFINRRHAFDVCYADPVKAKELRGWVARYDIDCMCVNAWR